MPPSIRFYKASRSKKPWAKPFYLYDPSIENVQERKEKRKTFATQSALCEYLGAREFGGCFEQFTNTEAIRKGKRFFSKKHNKEFIIRNAE